MVRIAVVGPLGFPDRITSSALVARDESASKREDFRPIMPPFSK